MRFSADEAETIPPRMEGEIAFVLRARSGCWIVQACLIPCRQMQGSAEVAPMPEEALVINATPRLPCLFMLNLQGVGPVSSGQ